MRTPLVDASVDRDDYITVEDVARDMGVTRQGLGYGMRYLSIEVFKFPYDRRSYIKKEDADRMKRLRRAALEGVA